MVIFLKYGIPVTRIKVTEIKVNILVIKSVDKVAEEDKIVTQNFDNKLLVLLYTNDCLAGVNYEDKNENDDKNVN